MAKAENARMNEIADIIEIAMKPRATKVQKEAVAEVLEELRKVTS